MVNAHRVSKIPMVSKTIIVSKMPMVSKLGMVLKAPMVPKVLWYRKCI